jgi:hypothetical protein
MEGLKDDLLKYCQEKDYIEGIFRTTRTDLFVKFQEILKVIDRKVHNIHVMR